MANSREPNNLSRRQFLGLTAASGTRFEVFPDGLAHALERGREKIVIHAEHSITRLGDHNELRSSQAEFILIRAQRAQRKTLSSGSSW